MTTTTQRIKEPNGMEKTPVQAAPAEDANQNEHAIRNEQVKALLIISATVLGVGGIFNFTVARSQGLGLAALLTLCGIIVLLAINEEMHSRLAEKEDGDDGSLGRTKQQTQGAGSPMRLRGAQSLLAGTALIAGGITAYMILGEGFVAELDTNAIGTNVWTGFLAKALVALPLVIAGVSLWIGAFPEVRDSYGWQRVVLLAIFGALVIVLASFFFSGVAQEMAGNLLSLLILFWQYDLFAQLTLIVATVGISYAFIVMMMRLFESQLRLDPHRRRAVRMLIFVGLLVYVALAFGYASSAFSEFGSFIEAVKRYRFLQRALISAIAIGIVSAVIGVFILLRGMVFLGQAIAHSAFAGAALAVLLGADPLAAILVFSIGSALGIGYVNEKEMMKNEVVVGIVFSAFMAMAVFFIGLIEIQTTDVNSLLFGNILLTTKSSFDLLILVTTLVLATILLIKGPLFYMTFDSEMAKISGVPVRFLNYLFLTLVALTISVSLKAIGAILVFAMVVTPAAAAYQWTYKLNKLLLLSAVFGVGSSVFGLFLSFAYDLPSGSTIVALTTLLFVFSFAFSPKRTTSEVSLAAECLEEDCALAEFKHLHIDGKALLMRQDLPDHEPVRPHTHLDKLEQPVNNETEELGS